MHIGVDIDEVLAASFEPVFAHAKEKHGFTAQFEDIIHHDWWNIPNFLSKDDTIATFKHCIKTFSREGKIMPVEGSVEGIRQLKEKGHKLHAITGRSEEIEGDETRQWLDLHFPGAFETVNFTSHIGSVPRKKSDVCLALGIESMIEDNMDFALDMLEKGVGIYLLEKPWNRQRRESHPHLIRIKGWTSLPYEFLI